MHKESRNIYQIARESAGYTQEKAAELLDVSVESVRAYESSRRVPPDSVVLRMIEVYNTQYLAYQHLKTNEQLAQKYLPTIELRDLPSAILSLYKEVTEFIPKRDRLIEITCDGIIDETERPDFDAIMANLDGIAGAVMALKFAKTG